MKILNHKKPKCLHFDHEEASSSLINLLQPFGFTLHTLPLDKGRGFEHHETIAQALAVSFPPLRFMVNWAP